MRKGLTAPGVATRLKSDRAVSVARRLRKAMTPAEQALWYELRRLRLNGSHFRKQAPIGPFVVDFVCHGARLVIELDGGAHDASDVALRDAERQQWIEGRGYRVLRLVNSRVLANAAGVAKEILSIAAARLSHDA